MQEEKNVIISVKNLSKNYSTLAVLKDIQDPDLDDNKESNWNVTSEAIMKSLDK